MFLTKQRIDVLTPIEGDRGHEILRLIENIGRTCWQSEETRQAKLERLMRDPKHEPESWQPDDPIDDLTKWANRHFRADRKVTDEFIQFLVRVGHESVLEHGVVSVRFIVDRATSHQLVRHRVGSYAQESQRWCDQKNHVAFIMPDGIPLEPGFYSFSSGSSGDPFANLARKEDQRPEIVMPIDMSSWAHTGMPRTWLKAMAFAEIAYLDLRSAGVKAEDARGVLPNATKTDIVATFNLRQWRHVFQERAVNPKAQGPIRAITGEVLAAFQASPLAPAFSDFHD